jgi:hypothetical protein
MFNPLDHLPQAQKDLISATEAREASEMAAEQAERQDQAWAAARMAQHYEDLRVWQTGHSSQEWQAAAQNAAVVREARNAAGEYGSPERPFGMWTGADGAVHRFEPRELAAGPVRADGPEEQLARARANPPKGRAFMEAEVRRFDARQRGAGKPAISRSVNPGEARCIECAAENLSETESYDVHHDPRFGDPLPPVTVPDYPPPPQRSRRVRAGLGWPELSR